MFRGEITFDTLTMRYPASFAEYVLTEIAKADRMTKAANQNCNQDTMTPLKQAVGR
jgi:hypothetical protein